MFLKRIFLILFSIFVMVQLFSFNVLFLYKEKEQGYGQSIIQNYLIPVVKEMGIKYTIKAVEYAGYDFQKYDLLISVYYTPSMREARKYIKALSKYILNGGKVFIINNFGAFANERGEYLNLEEINSFFNLIGITYLYGWENIEIEKVKFESKYLEVKDIIFKKRDVEKYVPFVKGTKVIMKVFTKKGKEYPVAFIGKNGSLILFNYIFDDKERWIFNVKEILKELLYNKEESKLLLVGENFDIEKALDDAGLKYEILNEIPVDIQEYYGVIVFDKDIKPFEEKIMEYISDGGVFLLIKDGGNEKYVDSIKITNELYPIPVRELSLSINSQVKFMNSPEDSKGLIFFKDYKLSWVLDVGNGKYIYYPKSLITKEFRGLFLQILLSNIDLSVQPLVGIYTFYLDDFPLPSYDRHIDLISREFGNITDGEFYYNVWWKDMKQIARKFGIRYTTVLVLNYDLHKDWPMNYIEFTQTPFPFLELEDLLKTNFELGIHGYNHLSPLKKNWQGGDLELAYTYLKKFIKDYVGENFEVRTFIAPNNLIDDFGFKHLKRIFPTIKVVATAYLQEYFSELEIKEDTLILPRNTYGYYPYHRLIQNTVLSLMNTGAFQYFIHPDDLFSTDRNPSKLKWKEMKNIMEKFLMDVKETYPWLENKTAYESYDYYFYHLKEKPVIFRGKDWVEISFGNMKIPRKLLIRSKKRITVKGAKILYSYENGIYVIEAHKREVIVEQLH